MNEMTDDSRKNPISASKHNKNIQINTVLVGVGIDIRYQIEP